MTRKSRNKKSLVVIVIITLFACIGIIIYQRRKLNIEGIYSIATIIDIEAIRSSLKVTITYPYQGRVIKNSSGGFMSKEIKIGNRYYVNFLPDNPQGNFNLLLNNKVPDSIQIVPFNGWEKIPK